MSGRNLVAVLFGVLAAGALSVGTASAQANGSGTDADGDSNPAVNTKLIARIGDAAEAALDPPFEIVTFETGDPKHGDTITSQKVDGRTVTFSKGLTRQICNGQRYFRYDTQCTYLAAPSGKFAAVYRDDFARPLQIEFEQPVCAAALAVYPTGGQEGETFKVVLTPFTADGAPLPKAEYEFNWTKDTFRWRLMAGALFLDQKAKRVDVSVLSKRDPRKAVRFLIDDVAFIENDCALAMGDINAEGGYGETVDASDPAAEAPAADDAASDDEPSGS